MAERKTGIHPVTRIGGPPESRIWIADPSLPTYEPYIDATALVQSFVTVDSGLTTPTHVGARTLLMAHVHVGHDAWIGDDVELSTGTVIGGHAVVEDRARIGINATILPYKRIGEGARVGAGSVVTKHVPAGEVWAGNPARHMQTDCLDCRNGYVRYDDNGYERTTECRVCNGTAKVSKDSGL